MADKKEEIKAPEREISASEQRTHFEMEGTPLPEKKEITPDERLIADELRREIEMMETDENLKAEVRKKAQEIDFLGGQDKVGHLLKIAEERGLVFAIKTAKEMKDEFILDIFHDVLARDGYYKKFTR